MGSYNGRPWFQLVAEGAVPRYSVIHKFGENTDVDTATVPESLWDQGGLYTFSETADITQISSSDDTDTHAIEVQGLDANWDLVIQYVILDGVVPVTLTTPLIRIFRMKNGSATELLGDVYVSITGAILTLGVPNTVTEIRAKISVGHNQTMMCIFTIPANCHGFMYQSYVTFAKANTSTGATLTMKMRPFGGVFQTKSSVTIQGAGSSNFKAQKDIPSKIPAKTDIMIQVDNVGANDVGLSGGFTIVLKDLIE